MNKQKAQPRQPSTLPGSSPAHSQRASVTTWRRCPQPAPVSEYPTSTLGLSDNPRSKPPTPKLLDLVREPCDCSYPEVCRSRHAQEVRNKPHFRSRSRILISERSVCADGRGGRHEAAKHGRSKPRNQRWIDFLRSTMVPADRRLIKFGARGWINRRRNQPDRSHLEFVIKLQAASPGLRCLCHRGHRIRLSEGVHETGSSPKDQLSTSVMRVVIFAESMLPFASSRVMIRVPFSPFSSSSGRMPWARYHPSFSSQRRR